MMLRADGIAIAGRLAGVSADFARGQITAICGPNGAGKSTLLAALAGLLDLDEGRALLDDETVGAIAPRLRARQIGFLPQNGEVAWDVSVRNLVALGRLPFGDRISAPVDRAIAAMEMGDLADRPVSTLSGGERARALLARVLAGEPRWILADEPLAALDLAHQMHLLRYFRQIAAAGTGGHADMGTGVIIVLHDLALAMNHADRVLVLDRGRVAAFGPPDIALDAERIAAIWGVEARWIGEGTQRALIAS